MYFMGIDVGTSSVKVLVMDEYGNIKASVSQAYPIFYPRPDWAEQNPEDWWKATKQCINKMLSMFDIDAGDIKAVGVTGQMHGLVLMDSDNNLIRPAILWNDQRTKSECEYIIEKVGRENLSELTGNTAFTGFTAPKILWVRNNEEYSYKKISHILLPKDYIRYKLSDEFATDVSDASGTLLFDVEHRTWSLDMLRLLDIPLSWLPESYESSQAVGCITKKAAADTGLNEGTLVVAGGGDQACGAIGTGTVNDGVISVSLGTSGVVFASRDSYSVDKLNRLHTFCHADKRWYVMGVMLSAASCLKWWVENNSPYNVDELLNMASNSKIGGNRLIFLPYMMGERTPYSDPCARGCLIGLNMLHTRGDITRAIMEGVAYGLRDSFEIIKSMEIPINEVRLSGGGSNSRLWRQIISDVFDTKVGIVNTLEGPSYGAAILSAVGYGYYDNVEQACRSLINVRETVSPIKNNVDIYNDLYSIFTGLYRSLKDTFADISALS